MAACGDNGDPSSPPDNRPELTGTVSIDNTSPKVGNTLTASYSGGNGSGTATWQWIRDESTNIGTNSNTYTVAAADEGKTIKVQVSFADQKSSRTSTATGVVTVVPSDNRSELTGTVTIDNMSPQIGDTLTAAYSDGNGTGTATWQWIRGESTNIGTDSEEYTVVEADWGQTIRAQVSFSGQKGSKTSDVTDAAQGGQLTANKWTSILQAIQDDDSFDGTLDLSIYTRTAGYSGVLNSQGMFEPPTLVAGIDKIKSIILPDAAASVSSTEFAYSSRFNILETITGANVTAIGNAFQGNTTLKSVDFPKVTTIAANAFQNCTVLETANFAAATTVGNNAFKGCSELATVELPEATEIGNNAFEGCFSLININFPKASSVGASAFLNCTNLDRATLPLALTVGGGAFEGCSKLAHVYLPSVSSIGASAFVNAGAQFLDNSYSGAPAFRVILGKEPPTLGVSLFGATTTHTGAFHVRVEIPEDANLDAYVPDLDEEGDTFSGGYVRNVWGDGFRGRGWNGSGVIQAAYNINVTLRISYYWD
jgi:hypothetical protein